MRNRVKDLLSKRLKSIKVVPQGRSAVRHIIADMQGTEGAAYRPLTGYAEAKGFDDAYAVMEGDWGGQIYLVVPMRLVGCSEENLRHLLQELDEIAWPDQSEGQGLYYERFKLGQVVPGGMRGGLALESLWIHEEFIEYGLAEKIRGVIAGKRLGLDMTSIEMAAIRELDKRRIERKMKEARERSGKETHT